MTAVTTEELQNSWESLGHNDVTRPLANEVVKAIALVEAYNKEHASDATGPTTADIDKVLRQIAKGEFTPAEGQVTPSKELVREAKSFVAEEDKFKEIAKAARKNIKKDVYGQEVSEETETDADEAQIREVRRVGYNTLALLVDMAKVLGLTDVHEYFKRLPFPQVGREGVSMVGVSKPRAQVKMGDTIFEGFAEAAKGLGKLLSTEDTTVTVDTNEMIIEWQDAGSPTNAPWTYKNTELVVVPKENKAAAAKKAGNGS